ncbi:MAG TPA: RidA family protein [Blastocatellia bacterium]|nr:RidA family protein [Blastocatellia bacterium]
MHIRPSQCLLVVAFAMTLSTASNQPAAESIGQARATAQAPVEYSSAKSSSTRPFSDVVRVGNMLYLAGKLGTDGSGKLASGGIAGETRQTLENIKTVLESNGSSLDHVVKCTVMLADMKEWAEMNSVYTTFFKKDRMPARSAFGTSGLALNARVEIECIAVVK